MPMEKDTFIEINFDAAKVMTSNVLCFYSFYAIRYKILSIDLALMK